MHNHRGHLGCFFNQCLKAHSSNSQMPCWRKTRHLIMSTHDTMNGCHSLRMGFIPGSSPFRAAFLIWVGTYFVIVCWNHVWRMRWKKPHSPSQQLAFMKSLHILCFQSRSSCRGIPNAACASVSVKYFQLWQYLVGLAKERRRPNP